MITSQISQKLEWFDTGLQYKKKMSSKLYGTTFEYFITQAKTDRYNITCSLVAHDRLHENKTDYESSIGDIVIPNDATVKAIKSLSATFNFIDTWHHNFCENHFARSESYRLATKDMFKTIPQNVEKR